MRGWNKDDNFVLVECVCFMSFEVRLVYFFKFRKIHKKLYGLIQLLNTLLNNNSRYYSNNESEASSKFSVFQAVFRQEIPILTFNLNYLTVRLIESLIWKRNRRISKQRQVDRQNKGWKISVNHVYSVSIKTKQILKTSYK